MSDTSCKGCKFLYGDGTGYSDYTWMETYIRCAKDTNPYLKGESLEEPYNIDFDRWEPTKHARCPLYSPGPMVVLSPDRGDPPESWECDDEAREAIRLHDEGA